MSEFLESYKRPCGTHNKIIIFLEHFNFVFPKHSVNYKVNLTFSQNPLKDFRKIDVYRLVVYIIKITI